MQFCSLSDYRGNRLRRETRSTAQPGARIGGVSRVPRVHTPMAGWRLSRWLLFYLAMLLADAAVIVAVIEAI